MDISKLKRKKRNMVLEIVDDSRSVKTTWAGWRSMGSVNYNKTTGSRELINNALVNKAFGRMVNVQLVFDSVQKVMYITDDMEGFPHCHSSGVLAKTLDLGESFDTSAILSEHGMGMKSAINYFGIIDYIKSTNDGFDFTAISPDFSKDHASFQTYKSDPIERYDALNKCWKVQEKPGAQIKINLSNDQIPGNRGWFTNLKLGLEKSYFDHFGVTLSVDIVWLKDDDYYDSWVCKQHKVLLSSARAVEDGKLDENGNPYTYLGKDKKMGANTWDVDEPYNCPETGISVHVKVGRVPTHKNVEKYYKESGDQTYNPDTYSENPFQYGADTMGLSYCKMGIPITFNNFKASSRSSATIGFIDIKNGIKTTKTKDQIKRTVDVEVFEEGLVKWLKKKGIRVRALAGYHNISESEMEKNLLDKLRRSSKLRKYLDLDNCIEFDDQWSSHSGDADIVGLIQNKKVDTVIEIKKEGSKHLWKALFQGTAYCYDGETKNLLIVAQDPKLPSDIQIKVEIFIQNGWNIRYEQYQKLMEI